MSCRHLDVVNNPVKTLYNTTPQIEHRCGLKTDKSTMERITLGQVEAGLGSMMQIGYLCPYHRDGSYGDCPLYEA